ncbi:asparagine--tRNA ligase [Candidatus Nardonella dryophthoridicola]|uniref:asparagine--tRNA ligase n=1 Tax=Candidatus Nardonella dryophthoridicola TaxID=1971485 RepID=UPI001AD860C1|nr:asparagine--tRNA ligase [Candidatus Nardonella dryophthoridicola]QTJ62782.1 asparagine--tRNA ligase [Candidatus Nardonella dryophthoridicola]
MKILLIINLFKKYNLFINKKIYIFGWIKNIRYSKNYIFIEINDGSCIKNIQILYLKNKNINYIKNINIGYSVFIFGKVIISKNINKQKIEILLINFKIIGNIENQKKYPISSSKYNKIEFIRKFFHLRPRSKFFGVISRIRNFIYIEINNFLNKNNFIWVQTPIITSVDTENSGNSFKVSSLDIYNNNNKKELDFFKKESFLTVSGQLNLESYALSMSKVYSFGPVFRADNSNTKKHLSEFWMLELEVAFRNIKYIIKFTIYLIKKIFHKLLNKLYDDVYYISKYNNYDINKVYNDLNKEFITLEYYEVVNILKKKFNIKCENDITTKYENILLKYFNCPIIIKNFPKSIKPFYMKLNKNNLTVSSFDIIFPNVGEIVGGSEREYRKNLIIDSIKNNNMNINLYKWYIDLRKYGTVAHSGMGIGFERLLMYFTGIKNIKDIIPFPRYPNNLHM